jgi:hypothetical protein
VARHNRQLTVDALLKVIIGSAFSLIVFGFLFVFGWFIGGFFGSFIGLYAWQFGAVFAGLFLVVAMRSAWLRVDPLSGLRPLTNAELILTIVGPKYGLHFFSPRHASAGAAVVILGGPASVLEGLGIWISRLCADKVLIEQASELLAACLESCPVEEISNLDAAVLLKRLALVKIVPTGESSALTVTQKGESVLYGKERGRKKHSP